MKQRFWVVPLLLLLLALLQYRLWFRPGGIPDASRLEEAITTQRTENRRLRECNERMRAELIDLKAGKEALEERARYDLGMVKEGEIYIHVIEEGGAGRAVDRLPPLIEPCDFGR